jgi:hypothetical protein
MDDLRIGVRTSGTDTTLRALDRVENELRDVSRTANTTSNNIDNLYELDFTGFGNKYNGRSTELKVTVNESVDNALNYNKFYTDGKNVYVTKVNSIINENLNKPNNQINEHVEKMKHLLGYTPKNYVDTTKIKQNRGF